MTKTKEGSFSTSIWMNLQSVYTRQITTRNVSHSKSFAKIHLLKLKPDSYCLLIGKFLQCSLERHSKPSTLVSLSLLLFTVSNETSSLSDLTLVSRLKSAVIYCLTQ